jgi:hypothetical protein
VQINAGLIDFMFQAAKAVIAAQQPKRSTDGRWAITALGSIEEIRSTLAENPEPSQKLYRNLEAYLFHGRTRSRGQEDIPEERHLSLSTMIGLAERFVIAHEYGHRHTADISWNNPDLNRAWVRELLADAHATVITVLSAHTLDRMPPEFAIQGGAFALACVSVLRRAFSIIRTGGAGEDSGSDEHPPDWMRAQHVVDVFHRTFDVEYDDAKKDYTLELASERPDARVVSENARKHIDQGGFVSANVLNLLWEFVEPMLMRDHANNRQLHSMWQ